MAKLRMAHASTHGARKPPGPKVCLIIFDIENVQYNHEWISECIHGSFKSTNEYPNVFIVVFESEYFRIWKYSLGIIRISECIWIFVTLWFQPSPQKYMNWFLVLNRSIAMNITIRVNGMQWMQTLQDITEEPEDINWIRRIRRKKKVSVNNSHS